MRIIGESLWINPKAAAQNLDLETWQHDENVKEFTNNYLIAITPDDQS